MEYFVRPARQDEYDLVKNFYYDLIDRMQGMEYHPKWQKGIYPDEVYMKQAVEKGQMYLCLEQGEGQQIAGAMVINQDSNDGYEGIQWSTKAELDEVTLIHTLAVMPEVSRRGIGSYMVKEAKRIAAANHQKVIRLDVIKGNLPAERLYQKEGFQFVKRVELFYEDTGWCEFDLYECPLD